MEPLNSELKVLIKVLCHRVTGDGKGALKLLKGPSFSWEKNLRQRCGLVGSGFASELSKISEERRGVFPPFL